MVPRLPKLLNRSDTLIHTSGAWVIQFVMEYNNLKSEKYCKKIQQPFLQATSIRNKTEILPTELEAINERRILKW
jgi:hypothetical protein